jgi:YD repeat-containing protein
VVLREYDGSNRLLRVIDQREGTDTTSLEYNGKGQVTRQWIPGPLSRYIDTHEGDP